MRTPDGVRALRKSALPSARPAHEVPAGAAGGDLSRAGAVAVHDPRLDAAVAIGVKGDLPPVGREEGVGLGAGAAGELLQRAVGDVHGPDLVVARAGREEHQRAAIGRPVGLVVAAGAGRHLPLHAVGQRADPEVHVALAIGIEGDRLAVARPGGAALDARGADEDRGIAGGTSGDGIDRQAPHIGVDAEHGEGEALAVGCRGELEIGPGPGGELLSRPGRYPRFVDRHAPDVEAATARGAEVDEASRRRPGGVEVGHVVVGDDGGGLGGEIDHPDVGPRLQDAAEDEPRAVGRPARGGMHDGLDAVAGDLLRVAAAAVGDPDAARPGPAGVKGEAGAVGRPGGIERLLDEQLLVPEAMSSDQMSPPSAYQPSTSPGSSLPVGRLARTKASRLPSGDQEGWMSSFGAVVSWRSSPVARSLTNNFLKPPTSCEKASCFPSGDQAGHSSTPS